MASDAGRPLDQAEAKVPRDKPGPAMLQPATCLFKRFDGTAASKNAFVHHEPPLDPH